MTGNTQGLLEITSRQRIGLLLFTTVMRQQDAYFSDQARHDLKMSGSMEDLHSVQLMKMVGQQFLTIHLFTHDQEFYIDKIQRGKVGRWQKLFHCCRCPSSLTKSVKIVLMSQAPIMGDR